MQQTPWEKRCIGWTFQHFQMVLKKVSPALNKCGLLMFSEATKTQPKSCTWYCLVYIKNKYAFQQFMTQDYLLCRKLNESHFQVKLNFYFQFRHIFWFTFLTIFSFSQKLSVEMHIPIFILCKIMYFSLRVGTQTNFTKVKSL